MDLNYLTKREKDTKKQIIACAIALETYQMVAANQRKTSTRFDQSSPNFETSVFSHVREVGERILARLKSNNISNPQNPLSTCSTSRTTKQAQSSDTFDVFPTCPRGAAQSDSPLI